MKKFIFILAILVFASSAQAATYTLCDSGCTYSDGATMLAALDLAPDDIVDIAGSLTISSAVSWGSNDYGSTGQPVVITSSTGSTITCTDSVNCLYFGNPSYITVQNLTFVGTSSQYYLRFDASSANSSEIVIDNVTTPGGATEMDIRFTATAGYTVSDITIQNCTGTDTTGDDEWVRFYAYDRFYDVTVSNNTISGYLNQIRFYPSSEAAIGTGDLSPYGVDIDGNTLSDPYGAWIAIQTGLDTEGQNYIRNNTCTSAGDSTVALINGLQLQWIRNTIIEYNSFDGIDTSSCDGNLVTIDYAFTSGSYISDGNIVQGNYFLNGTPTTCAQGGGLSISHGADTDIYSNVFANCRTGLWISDTNSTGNVVVNNTFYNSGLRHIRVGVGTFGGPAVTVSNNVLDTSGAYGIYTSDSAPAPTMATNSYSGSTTADRWSATASATFADASAITTNPQLTSEYKLGNSSLIGAGTWVSAIHGTAAGRLDINGNAIKPGSVSPGAIQWSPSGFGRISR